MTKTTADFQGTEGKVVYDAWEPDGAPRIVVVLAHGIGEHIGRYAHVIDALLGEGAAVYGPDHLSHGRSDGEPAKFTDVDHMAEDLHHVITVARDEHPGLPLVLVGHSLGGVISTRYVQLHGGLDALVLSGPVVGGNSGFEALLGMDPFPEVPLDPSTLSRDPAVGEAYLADPLVYSGPLHRESVAAIFDAVAKIADGPTFGDLPVLWIHGEEDALAPYLETKPAMERLGGPNTTAKSYPEARHEIFNETNQDEVIGDVLSFLRTTFPA